MAVNMKNYFDNSKKISDRGESECSKNRLNPNVINNIKKDRIKDSSKIKPNISSKYELIELSL